MSPPFEFLGRIDIRKSIENKQLQLQKKNTDHTELRYTDKHGSSGWFDFQPNSTRLRIIRADPCVSVLSVFLFCLCCWRGQALELTHQPLRRLCLPELHAFQLGVQASVVQQLIS